MAGASAPAIQTSRKHLPCFAQGTTRTGSKAGRSVFGACRNGQRAIIRPHRPHDRIQVFVRAEVGSPSATSRSPRIRSGRTDSAYANGSFCTRRRAPCDRRPGGPGRNGVAPSWGWASSGRFRRWLRSTGGGPGGRHSARVPEPVATGGFQRLPCRARERGGRAGAAAEGGARDSLLWVRRHAGGRRPGSGDWSCRGRC